MQILWEKKCCFPDIIVKLLRVESGYDVLKVPLMDLY